MLDRTRIIHALVSKALETMSDFTVTIIAGNDSPGPMPAWITPALLARTIEVWSEAYGRPVETGEAVELLTNVKRLGEALIRARREAT